jgi:hypothetical protein
MKLFCEIKTLHKILPTKKVPVPQHLLLKFKWTKIMKILESTFLKFYKM